MKRSCACQCCFESEEWDCPQLRASDQRLATALICFNGDPPVSGNGFKPRIFRKARPSSRKITSGFARGIGSSNGRCGNYFPDAENFFEVGCGTGFVLKGIRETLPRMRLDGQRDFWRRSDLCASAFAGRGSIPNGCARRFPSSVSSMSSEHSMFSNTSSKMMPC